MEVLVEILEVLVEILFLFVVTCALSPAVTSTPSIKSLLPYMLIGILLSFSSSAHKWWTFVPSLRVEWSSGVIREFLPMWIFPSACLVIIGLPSILKPSAVISISLPSAPIWIDPSEFIFAKVDPPTETLESSIFAISSLPEPPSVIILLVPESQDVPLEDTHFFEILSLVMSGMPIKTGWAPEAKPVNSCHPVTVSVFTSNTLALRGLLPPLGGSLK